MSSTMNLMWFRQDLRTFDNTAFAACCEHAQQNRAGVIAVVYLTPKQWQSHRKSLWQIDLILRQIRALEQSLSQLNIGIIIRVVDDFALQATDVLELCQQLSISHLFANLEYPVNELARDQYIAQQAQSLGIVTQWFDDSQVIAPQRIVTDKGMPYKVFTPFYKRWLAMVETGGLTLSPTPAAMAINTTQLAKDSRNTNTNTNDHITIDAFYRAYLNPTPALDKQLNHVVKLAQLLYPAGEVAAQSRLDDFLKNHIADYNTARDVPALNNHLGATSRLSPYLAIGMLSPRLCYLKARQKLNSQQGLASEKDIMRWISELAWRDFYYDVMVNRPDIVKGKAFLTPLDESVAWRYDLADFESWYQGKTGVPLVDAAMRCLNSTGFMHNRLRMVVAMYLSKNLLIDWRWGEAYFMQHLVDGDFANNNGGWQWSASVGTDAQPYFRVMNPFNQAATHDPDASYIQYWVPELATVPANIINDEQKLQTYLKQHPHIAYPKLATPTKVSRAMAIDAFKKPVE